MACKYTGSVVAIITYACNFACKHCMRGLPKAEHLPLAMFEELVKQANSLNAYLEMTGGECVLHPDFERFCELLLKSKRRINITSNVWLIDRYEFLKNTNTQFRVSLDGASAETHDYMRKAGSFDRVCAALQKLKAWKIPAYLHCVISKHSVHELDKLFKFAASNPVTRLTISTVVPTDTNRDLVLSAEERLAFMSKVEELRIKYPEANAVLTGLSRPKTGVGMCPYLVSDSVMPALNPSGMWSLCCNTIYRGDESLGRFPDVSVINAMKAAQDTALAIIKKRIEIVNRKEHLRESFQSCEFCSNYFNLLRSI